jgi:two-component system, NarL family, response regulator DevR
MAMRVFIVENSAIIRERLVSLLSDLQGVEVIGSAEDAVAAIESIRLMMPDVVILDVQMPGGSGFNILQDIRQNRLPAVVIIFTNSPFPQYRQRFIEAGADFFLDKSTEFDKLLDIFNRLAQSRDAKTVS